jgi:hypothetical protein
MLDCLRTFGQVEGVKVLYFLKGVPRVINLATVENCYWDSRVLINVSGDAGDRSDNFYSRNNLAKDYMFTIKMRSGLECYEELRGVSVST